MGEKYMELGERTEGGASLLVEGYWHEMFAGEDVDVNQVRVIRRLRTAPEKRNKGDATFLMAKTVVEADDTGSVLVLDAIPDADSPLDAGALELFYMKFGFKHLDRGSCPSTMVRSPRNVRMARVQ